MGVRIRIQEMWLKVKFCLEAVIAEWGVIAVVLLTAGTSFCLGRLSAFESARPPVAVLALPLAAPADLAMGGLFVASKNGSVYHYPWCPGASRISEANKRWFQTEEAARNAGLRPSKDCKGLQP